MAQPERTSSSHVEQHGTQSGSQPARDEVTPGVSESARVASPAARDGAVGQGGAKPLRVLIACEFSGVVREAFRALGHDAWSCDLLPAEDGSPHHFQGDCFAPAIMYAPSWDLLVAFPPCTRLCSSGARWFAAKRDEQEEAVRFFESFVYANVPRIAIENPIGIMSTRYRKPDQIIQPWMFGHGETKATCLWLKNLPKLVPTNVVEGRKPRVHFASPGPDRWKERSRTLPGIAKAMAEQWGLRVEARRVA